MLNMLLKGSNSSDEALEGQAHAGMWDSGPLKTKLVRVDWLIIVTLSIVALALRLYSIGYASFWFDELWTWRVSHLGFGGLFQALKEDIHLPCFFMIEVVFIKLFGDSEAVLRVPSVIFGTLAVGAVYVLGRRLFGRLVGFMAAIMVVFGVFSFFYSQEARPYAMMLFLGSVTSYLWYQLYERIFVDQQPPGKLGMGLWVLLVISCFTHYFAVLLTLFQLTIFACVAFKYKRGRKLFGLYCGGLALLALLWTPILAAQLSDLFTWTQAMSFLAAFWNEMDFNFGGMWMGVTAGHIFQVLVLLVTLLFLFKKGASFLRPETPREYNLASLVFAVWLIPFVFVQTITMLVTPIFVDKYLIFTMPFALFALTFQIERLRIPVAGRIAVALLLVGLPACFSEKNDSWYTGPNRNHLGDWKSVITDIKGGIPSKGKTVLLAITERTGVAEYYFGKIIPELPITAVATKRVEVPKAVEMAIAAHPDHILFFYGEAVQPEQVKTVILAGGMLQKRYGKPRYISFERERPIGALMFDVKH